ncbi:Predicted Zn-dependent peptidase [Filimonas lacunae]|uniref:Predicted Zn-dependent peptidase n=1 Tax=Filimonas lacunae TaxID=477680 RepID=A0A1N7Q7E4_9BACT|nr:pitrilysin family protein [Filimonas lacunae]SIT18775.1 Predicted Zn-dependent peptidase [Filimonas lacunae]
MRSKFLGAVIVMVATSTIAVAQKVQFTEYDLANGLHVILHQDKSAPVVAVSVMYHVGSKNEDTARTGFAHFFEHLLFEGTDNIKRGEFDKIVSSNGGQANANTTQDRTYYYELFPSNQLELGLWLESERMFHPVINEIGVKTQNEVVKEEKRQRLDNQPYGKFADEMFKRLFAQHPYHWQPIGSMDHLDAAKLGEFKAFFKKYYVPNNAVLSIAGDIDIEKTKALVKAYFEEIPKGAPVVQPAIVERPLAHEIIDSVYDANIQIPAIIAAYRIPGSKTRESKVMEMISTILSGGGSSRLYKKMVDDKKNALQVAAFNYALEDYGAYITLALPNNNASLDSLLADIDEEVAVLQKDLISEADYQKIQNQFENNYVSANSKMLGVAENLADGYTYSKNTNRINEELDEIRSITREEIREAARKYLQKNQRVVLYYLPGK